MVNEPRMTIPSEAIPMPYLVSETDRKVKNDDKVVNKNVKNKNRKRNKGNIVIENEDPNDV